MVFKGPSQPKPLYDSMSQVLSCKRQGLQNYPLKKKHWVGLLASNRLLKGHHGKHLSARKGID